VSAVVQRLRAEVAADRKAFEERVAELAALDLGIATASSLAQAAVALHHAFGAVEAALSRVARLLEGSVPEGPDSHRALLETMALEIPEVRPVVLSQASLSLLRRLLGFRHFFRHAYAVSFDAAQLEALRRDALSLQVPLAQDFQRLDAFLEAVARASP
jgi:hypothetical protein